MRKIRSTVTLLGALSLLGGISPIFGAPACGDLENKKPESLLEYLQGERSRLNRDCVLYAIEQLGNGHYAPAIKTLMGYLDYRKPDPPNFGSPTAPLIRGHSEWSGSIYPAGTALAQIGKPAIPQLAEVIAEASTSDLVRNNAGDVVFAIYREDPAEGIAAMVSAAHTKSDPMDSLRLMDQARRQAGRCSPQRRNDCENAVLK
jgi:hypothetical protein